MKRKHFPLLLLALAAVFVAPAAGQAVSLNVTNFTVSDSSPLTNQTVTLSVDVSGGLEPYSVSYAWSGDSSADCGGGAWTPTPAQWTTPGVPGTYALKAEATDVTPDTPLTGCLSRQISVADVPSAPSLSLSAAGPAAHVSGLIAYVNPGGPLSRFTVTATPNDPDVTAIRFPGTGLDNDPPYFARYDVGDLSAGVYSVVAVDASGLTSPAAQFEVVVDTAGPDPVAGFVNYPDANVADVQGAINVSWAPGSDPAGLAPGSGLLERQTVALAGILCDFSAATWAQVEQTNAAGSRPETVPVNTCSRYRYRISDNVGNQTVYAPPFVARNDPGDITPPGPVRRTRIKGRDHRVVLTYRLPTAPDFRRVKIYRWIAGQRAQTRGTLFNGKRDRVVDRAVFNGTRYVYQFVTCDRRDNCGEPGVLKAGVPRSRYLKSPRDGAVLTRPTTLDWKAHKRATRYAVQLLRRGRVVLQRFPRGSSLRLRSQWTYRGKRKLVDGTYYWYVYPQIGSRYGNVMGWSRFTKE